MVKWKCKASGTIVQLEEAETPTMLKHQGYEKIEEPVKEPQSKTLKLRKKDDASATR